MTLPSSTGLHFVPAAATEAERADRLSPVPSASRPWVEEIASIRAAGRNTLAGASER